MTDKKFLNYDISKLEHLFEMFEGLIFWIELNEYTALSMFDSEFINAIRDTRNLLERIINEHPEDNNK